MPYSIGRKFEVRSDPYCLISLLLKGFLRKEASVSGGPEGCLRGLERVKARDWGKWADTAARAFQKRLHGEIREALGRTLTESEIHFLAMNSRKWIELYGMSCLRVFET